MSNVFIIDDELQIAQMLAEVVEMAGFVPTIYTDARKFLEEQSYDNDSVILLDLNMPKKDGRTALREIRADEELRKIPIVVLTTSKSEEDVLKTYNLGVNSFITKPVTFEGLVEVVQIIGKYWIEIVAIPAKV